MGSAGLRRSLTARGGLPARGGSRGVVPPSLLLLAGVLLVAANLRAVLTVVGPLLPTIGIDREMSPSALGLLVSLPILVFALVSPLGHGLARRIGVERAVLLALIVLLVGTVLRSAPGPVALWLGTAVIGAGIAIANVLLPVVVRQDFPDRVPAVTGLYIAAQSVVAGLASGVAVPLSDATGSWELAIGMWAVLIAFTLASWLPRTRRPEPSTRPMRQQDPDVAPVVWRSVLAWEVAAYFGLQSSAFYVLVNWLPTVEQDLGISPTRAGWHLSVVLLAGIVANLATPLLMRLGPDERLAAVTLAALMVVAALGLVALPALVALWVTLAGMAAGGSMVVALSLISARSGSATAGSMLSSMVQSAGYLGVAGGLVVAGLIREVAGQGDELLLYVAVLATLQLLVGLRVGRARVLPTHGHRP